MFEISTNGLGRIVVEIRLNEPHRNGPHAQQSREVRQAPAVGFPKPVCHTFVTLT